MGLITLKNITLPLAAKPTASLIRPIVFIYFPKDFFFFFRFLGF